MWKQYSALGPRLLPLTISVGHHEETVSDIPTLRAPYQYVSGMSTEYQNHESKAGECFGKLDVPYAAAKTLGRGIRRCPFTLVATVGWLSDVRILLK